MKTKVWLFVLLLIMSASLAACGGGGGSSEPVPPLPAPVNVSATAGNEQVTITWDAVDGATSYNIYWSNTPGVTRATGMKIADVASPYVHLTGDGSNGRIFYYVVTAAGADGESAESAEVNATPTLEPPPPPGFISP
ncbi:MAG: fibronectin type III domain-containing protein [Nitrospirae bacterium]|nr:fibronectin type III domain-containing protein [Nitrospirota bacterium]